MWDIDFITREDFKEHVGNTINVYLRSARSYGLDEFNRNIVDPIKLTFDSRVYNRTLEEAVGDEVLRQRDKTNNNAIGYFHQNIFSYINNCVVPKTGFDVVFTRNNGTKVYVEMKNKHNTMNSSSSQKTFMRMRQKTKLDPCCECYLVEVIAKKSQYIVWSISLDGDAVTNDRIKRVSIDRFYQEVTGDRRGFYKICRQLPSVIDEVISEMPIIGDNTDSVIGELKSHDNNLMKSLYSLAFGSYLGFGEDVIRSVITL